MIRLGTIVALLALAAPAPARAPADANVAEARRLFDRGRHAFDRAQYEEALRAFEAAYQLTPRPLLLYNLGHTALRLQRLADARGYFARFLATDASGPERAEAEKIVARLDAQGTPAPRPEGAAAPPSGVTAPQPTAPPPTVTQPAPVAVVAAPVGSPPRRKSRAWLWGVAAAVAAGVAVGLGVGLGVPRSDAPPPTALGTVSFR